MHAHLHFIESVTACDIVWTHTQTKIYKYAFEHICLRAYIITHWHILPHTHKHTHTQTHRWVRGWWWVKRVLSARLLLTNLMGPVYSLATSCGAQKFNALNTWGFAHTYRTLHVRGTRYLYQQTLVIYRTQAMGALLRHQVHIYIQSFLRLKTN